MRYIITAHTITNILNKGEYERVHEVPDGAIVGLCHNCGEPRVEGDFILVLYNLIKHYAFSDPLCFLKCKAGVEYWGATG